LTLRRTDHPLQGQPQHSFHGRLNRALPGHLAGRAKGPGRLRGIRLGPGGASRCRIPKQARPQDMVVQFQHKEEMQLHQDGQPGRQDTGGTVVAKRRRFLAMQKVHDLKPATRPHPAQPGCRGQGSRKSPAAVAKSARPRSRWQTAVAYPNRCRARALPARDRGTPPARSS